MVETYPEALWVGRNQKFHANRHSIDWHALYWNMEFWNYGSDCFTHGCL